MAEAMGLEGRYRWEEAALIYERILRSVQADGAERPAISLRLAICHENAAFQKDNSADFRGKLRDAFAIYQEIERTARRDSPWGSRAGAGRLRLSGILAEDEEERLRLYDEALNSARDAIAKFEGGGSRSEFWEAGNFGLLLYLERFYLKEEVVKFLEEGLNLAEKMLQSHKGDTDVNVRAFAHIYRAYMAYSIKDHLEEWYRDKSRYNRIFQGTCACVKDVGDKRALVWHQEGALYTKRDFIGLEVTSSDMNELTELADATYDRQLIGRALYLSLYCTRWLLVAESEQGRAQVRFQEILRLFKEMEENLSHLCDPISQRTLASAYGDLVQSHYIYADFMTDVLQRQHLLEKAVSNFHAYLPSVRRISGSTLTYLMYAGMEALRILTHIVDDGRQRLDTLGEALDIAEEFNALQERFSPHFNWNIGVGYISEGSIRYEMAALTRELTKRKELLGTAVSRFRYGLEKLRNYPYPLPPGQLLRLGDFYLHFVRALSRLFDDTGDGGLLDEQIRASDLAAEAYSSVQRPARVAESIWNRARIRSRKGEHDEASKDYGRSSDCFREAADAVPALGDLYRDFEKYMLAWCRIEGARASHADGLYREASDTYRLASSILRETHRWSPLSDHYAACALLEGAEALCREENPELAAKAFSEAAEGFEAAKRSVSAWRDIEGAEEGEKESWRAVVAARERYSQARSGFEQAKVFDRKGKHDASARRFASAAAILEALAEEEETAEGKREMRSLALLGKAWGSMKEAEARGKADAFEEAARRFEDVAEAVTDGNLAAGCRGNAAFCRALELGARLRISHKKGLYRETKKCLEAAAESYIDAGMDRAANWTRATEYMFDGLVYFAQAEEKLEDRAKRRFYAFAESSFEAAARLYDEAGYVGKQEEAERRLEQAREKRRVFTSPAEALDSAIVLQAAQAQVVPSLTSDQPLGIERFDAPNVQANLIVDRPAIAVGEASKMRIELVNAGRTPAVIVKISELAPNAPGMEVVGEEHRIEAGTINLGGLRLNSFDTADIGLILRAERAGEYVLRPRISYVDERGRYQQHQPQPASIVAGGVSGKNAGGNEAPEPPPVEYEFNAPHAKETFDCLVDGFIEDYAIRRLYLEQAGWMTLSALAERAGVPVSALYGRRGGYGEAMRELLSRGLVETRVFTGQRGRGGEVAKVRISYNIEPVKRYVDRIMKRPK